VDIARTTTWPLTRENVGLSTIHRPYYDYYLEITFLQ